MCQAEIITSTTLTRTILRDDKREIISKLEHHQTQRINWCTPSSVTYVS